MPDVAMRAQWRRFTQFKRGYYALLILTALFVLSLFAELLVSNRALIVSYQGQWYFPSYGRVIPGTTFGLDYAYETNYRELQQRFASDKQGDWLLLPPVPYNPYETNLIDGEFPPYAPAWARRHYLGTDTSGRDIVARLVYGFRLCMVFALALLLFEYVIGATLGCLMGFCGGKVDLLGQRLIEIWSNIPGLYVIIIVASVVVPQFWHLLVIMACFSWVTMTGYMRTCAYKESAREYILAARAMGASSGRIIVKHILPNTLNVLVTFMPFSVAAGISALTSLDYLGFGLPAPTPSWGELLKQGTGNLESPWIVISVTAALTLVLVMVTFIGEAIREAFDARQHSFYR
ncbi:MAG: ABC transporter permease subunit [Cellvibrionaceae bacterium]|nr:ABC transporter permease subunit [Cellvibrionaceae bacterium]